jgi:hypothetical protein
MVKIYIRPFYGVLHYGVLNVQIIQDSSSKQHKL